MSNQVKLATPEAGPLTPYKDGGVDIVARVNHREMEWGWAQLRQIMENEPSPRMREWEADGFSEDDFRLRCGLFVAAANSIPMTAYNFIEWLRLTDEWALDNYVASRIGKLGDEELEEVLRDRPLEGLGLERVDQPSSRGPASLAAIKRAVAKLPPRELAQLEQAIAERRMAI